MLFILLIPPLFSGCSQPEPLSPLPPANTTLGSVIPEAPVLAPFRIIGEWEYMRTGDTIEFTKAGDVFLKSGGYSAIGKYQLIGNSKVKFFFEGWGETWINAMGSGDTWEIELTQNRMNVDILGQSTIFIL